MLARIAPNTHERPDMTSMSDWAAGEAAGHRCAQEDRDTAHVEAKREWDLRVAVELCLRFSEHAKAECLKAERELEMAHERRRVLLVRLARIEVENVEELRRQNEAVDAAHGVAIQRVIEAAQALQYLRRTTATLAQAIQLRAMGRR